MLTHETKVYKTWHHLNEGFMKIFPSLILLLFFSFVVSLPSFAQEAQVEGQNAPTPSVKKEQQTGNRASKKETQQFVIRVKTKQKVDFSGTVATIDPASASLSIRNQGKTISFDMSKSILIGYQSIGEIKKGDEVSVGYTQYGLQIRKGIFAVTHQNTTSRQQVIPQKVALQKAATRVDTTKPQRGAPIRMANNRYSTSFNTIDNNKDGKVTPIELCVLVPDLTIQKFKEYDKNSDGCLNESEYNTVKRAK